MKLVTYKIYIDDVLKKVRESSGYLGVKTVTENGNMYDLIAAIEEDGNLLGRYFVDACTGISTIGRTPIALLETHTEDISGMHMTLTYEMPNYWNYALKDKLGEEILSYITNSVLVAWLKNVNANMAESVAVSVVGSANNIAKILTKRVVPNLRDVNTQVYGYFGILPDESIQVADLSSLTKQEIPDSGKYTINDESLSEGYMYFVVPSPKTIDSIMSDGMPVPFGEMSTLNTGNDAFHVYRIANIITSTEKFNFIISQ